MVHAVYSNRDVFLRELISNAADACEKLRLLGLERPELLADDPDFANGYDVEAWPALRERLAALLATRTQAQWCELLEGTDACFAPVLTPSEAAAHPHLRHREVYSRAGGVLQANPAPRFSTTSPPPPGPIPGHGQHTEEVLRDYLKLEPQQLEALRAKGVV